MLTAAPLAHHERSVGLPARSAGIQRVNEVRVVEMQFVGVQAHYGAVLVVHLLDLPKILPAQPYVVVDLIPVCECCSELNPGDVE